MTDDAPPTKKLHRGIPEAIFLDDVDSYMLKETSSEAALQKLDEQYQKYKFMESNLVQKKIRLTGQVCALIYRNFDRNLR